MRMYTLIRSLCMYFEGQRETISMISICNIQIRIWVGGWHWLKLKPNVRIALNMNAIVNVFIFTLYKLWKTWYQYIQFLFCIHLSWAIPIQANNSDKIVLATNFIFLIFFFFFDIRIVRLSRCGFVKFEQNGNTSGHSQCGKFILSYRKTGTIVGCNPYIIPRSGF